MTLVRLKPAAPGLESCTLPLSSLIEYSNSNQLYEPRRENTFIWSSCSKYVGVGTNFALLKENESGDPQFLFFFLKGYIKVYEIKVKL